MKFRIVGADRQTGEDVEIIVDARDEVDAETIAGRRNIMVSSVVLVRSLPPEPQQSPPIAAKENVKQCPKCKEWINKGATKCPHCRSTQPAPPALPWAYAIAALLVIGPALWCCGPCSVFDSPEAKEPAEKAAAQVKERESETRSGRKLYVQANDVRVREAPSMSAAVILTVCNGHEVIEITRQGSWVEVGVARTGKIGWIPASSLGTVRHGGATVTPETPQFKRFNAAFEKLNSRIKSATGVTLFTHAEDMGDGILYVTATETWLSASKAERESNLRTIYEMWRAAEGSGLPIAVYVLDERGKIVMKLSGK